MTQPPRDHQPGEPLDPDDPTGLTEPLEPGEPTPEQWAERAKRANKATRGALAGICGLEALVVLLVPRAIAQTSEGLSGTTTSLLVALAVLLVATAFVLRRPFGIGLGSALQVPLILTGLLTTGMFVVGVVFAGIWLYTLNLRHQLVGTPSGLRMFTS